MEKIINIDGREVKLKSTAATPILFKQQFRKDFFAEIIKLNKIFGDKQQNLNDMTYEDIAHIDFDCFYNIIWILAKGGNSEIKEPITWLEEFSEFPLDEIFPEIQDMLFSLLQRTKKKR
ncbi:hypothetical protein ACWN8P_12505 [Vagococcus salmoninarum]|uniref:Prophage pi2 protein 40 n=1 Tax=Vagococcus salmoninarum TaxID=2739 RepID=A0A429ZSD8_9ENTE|nr:hypothetical protein [Vagococcus salmoninarum]RST96660.1 hypothetical protein CBF35_05355 [Vagococcus salmoninarum]